MFIIFQYVKIYNLLKCDIWKKNIDFMRTNRNYILNLFVI